MKLLILLLALYALGAAACTAGRRPRVLTDADLDAGATARVGESVLLTDFPRCFPRAAIRPTSQKGKWWLRSFRTVGGRQGKLLCVEERDKTTPESCLAPALTYPLKLSGTYDIWVQTYRPTFGGGIDLKLTRDKVYATIDPWEERIGGWPPRPEQTGRLVEVFWKTADLAGQSLHIRQPRGTYQSLW